MAHYYSSVASRPGQELVLWTHALLVGAKKPTLHNKVVASSSISVIESKKFLLTSARYSHKRSQRGLANKIFNGSA